MNEERDSIQERAEKARESAGKAFDHKLKEANVIHNLASNMVGSFRDPAEGYENTEDLVKEKMIKRKEERQVVRAAKQKEQDEHPFVINGYKLPMSRAEFVNAVTLLMFIFATELSKDPAIDSILKQAKFKFNDMDGNQIYPKQKEKKKKRNAKSRKRRLH